MLRKAMAAAVGLAAALGVTGCERGGRDWTIVVPVEGVGPVVEPAVQEEVVVVPAAVAVAVPDAGAERASVPVAAAPAQVEECVALAHEDAAPVDHLSRARDLEERGDYEGALAEVRRSVADEAGVPRALETAGRLARKVGQARLAAAAYAELARARPEDALPLLKLARVRIGLGDPAGAIDAAGVALALDPSLAEAHHLRGLGHLRRAALARAIRDFRKATALAPDHGWAQNNLGYALLLAGKPEEAREPLERAAALLPQVAFVYNNLGLAYEKLGLKEESQAAFDRAVELRPRYVKARVNSARAKLVAQVQLPEPAVAQPGLAEDPGVVGEPPAASLVSPSRDATPEPEPVELAPASVP